VLNYILIFPHVLYNKVIPFIKVTVGPRYNSFSPLATYSAVMSECRTVCTSCRSAWELFTYFNEMSSAIRRRHMAHVFNYLLSESTFAFEVSRDRIRGRLHRRMEILSYALYSVAYIRTRCTEMHNAYEIKNAHWIINEMFSGETAARLTNPSFLRRPRDASIYFQYISIYVTYARLVRDQMTSRKIIITTANRYILFACARAPTARYREISSIYFGL